MPTQADINSIESMAIIESMDEQNTKLPFTPENMKLRREELGMSQTKLGRLLTPPAGQRTVVHWEQGDYKIKSPRKEQVAKILGLALYHSESAAAINNTMSINNIRAEIALKQARQLIDDALIAITTQQY